MAYLRDNYDVILDGRDVGRYYVYNDGSSRYWKIENLPQDIEAQLKALKLDKDRDSGRRIGVFTRLTREKYRVPGTRRIIYEDGPLRLEREPRETNERYSVYRCAADEGDPDYSPLPHDAPHNEGPHTPEGMREWASWYAFVKMDDGNYQAELDEAWWWGGGHNDGGTIRRLIPEEWFKLRYDEFLENVVRLAAARHYGFTADMLKEKKGLKEFFGYDPAEREPLGRYRFMTLRERPELEDAAAAWFHGKWGVPEEAYRECMDEYLRFKTDLGWYLCLAGKKIVGGLGVIENDFHDRKDLSPNVCAVYTEEAHRGRGIAGRLLDMAVEDLRRKGISPAYLVTDHTGFYERYGWEFYCMVQGDGEPDMTRMYIHR